MRCYLIDTENVTYMYEELIPKLCSGDHIILFYTDNTASFQINMRNLNFICEKGAILKTVYCQSGHNALDFQLASFLGHLIAENKQNRYIIFSDDNGYAPLKEFWNKRGANVEIQIPTMKQELRKKQKTDQAKNQTPAAPTQKSETKSKKKKQTPTELPESQCLETYTKKLHEIGINGKWAKATSEALAQSVRLSAQGRVTRYKSRLNKSLGPETGEKVYNRTKSILDEIAASGPVPKIETK